MERGPLFECYSLDSFPKDLPVGVPQAKFLKECSLYFAWKNEYLLND